MIFATGCICGKHLLEQANEGTCLACGHGDVSGVAELAYLRNMERPPTVQVRAKAMEHMARQTCPVQWTEDDCIEAARDWEREHGELPQSKDWLCARLPGDRRPSYRTIHTLFGGWPAFMGAIADIPREAIAA